MIAWSVTRMNRRFERLIPALKRLTSGSLSLNARDTVVVQGLHKRMGVFQHVIWDDGGRHTLEERAKQLPDRVHKAEGGLLTAYFTMFKGIDIPHPVQPVEYLPLFHSNAFRFAG